MSTSVNKKAFKVTKDGKELEFAVVRPNHQQVQQGTLVYAKKYKEAVDMGVPIQDEMERILLPKIWNSKKQEDVDVRVKFLLDSEKRLAAGGNKVVVDGKELPGLTKKEARELSVQMRMKRIEIQYITMDRNKLFQNTAEAFAEQAKFDYYTSCCTVHGSGEKYFKSQDEYFDNADEDEVAREAQQQMMSLLYPVDIDARKGLPENRFLLKYGFCNENLELVKDGKRCDADGKAVNEYGQWLNEKGEPVDELGNLVTETGEFKVEFAEYLDDATDVKADASESVSQEVTENAGV